MAAAGDRFDNPHTGEQVTVVSVSDELLVLDDVWTRPGHRAAEHVHPGMEERFTVLEGCARVRADGIERDLGPGKTAVVPAGTPHVAWNPTQEPVRLRLEFRPALRWAEFVQRLFALEDLSELPALMAGFPDEIAPPPN